MNPAPPRIPRAFKVFVALFAISVLANVWLVVAKVPAISGGGMALESPDKQLEAHLSSLRDINPLRDGEIFGRLTLTPARGGKPLLSLDLKPAGVSMELEYRTEGKLEWSPDGKFLNVILPHTSIRIDVARLISFQTATIPDR